MGRRATQNNLNTVYRQAGDRPRKYSAKQAVCQRRSGSAAARLRGGGRAGQSSQRREGARGGSGTGGSLLGLGNGHLKAGGGVWGQEVEALVGYNNMLSARRGCASSDRARGARICRAGAAQCKARNGERHRLGIVGYGRDWLALRRATNCTFAFGAAATRARVAGARALRARRAGRTCAFLRGIN